MDKSDAELDPWTPAIRLLCPQSWSERKARSYVGKLVRKYGKRRVLKAVEEVRAMAIIPADVGAYLQAMLQGGEGPVKFSDEWIDQEFRAGRLKILAGESYIDVRRRLKKSD